MINSNNVYIVKLVFILININVLKLCLIYKIVKFIKIKNIVCNVKVVIL